MRAVFIFHFAFICTSYILKEILFCAYAHIKPREEYMKKAFRFSILTLALALCGGSVALIHAKANKTMEAKADTAVASDGSISYTLANFVNALETTNNYSFTILTNFTLTDTIDISGKTATIDLAGHTITGTATTMFSLTSSTNLTINSTGSKGKLTSESQKVFALSGASLTINNANLTVNDTVASYYPIHTANETTNNIYLNGVTITKGINGILLAGTSSLYASGQMIFSKQGLYAISCASSSSSIYLSGLLTVDKPFYTNNTVNFFNGNFSEPTYLSGFPKGSLEIVVTNALMHDGDIIIRGAQNPSILNSVTISGLNNTGYMSSVVDSTAVAGAKDVKTVYYSCVPQITGSKFTIISQTNPATYSTASSYNAEYILEADLGYFFGSQRSDYLTITIGGGDPLTSLQYSYGYTQQYYGAQYYKRCTINIPRNLVKGQLVIAVTPGVSNYLQTVRTFISGNMHMDDYDSELTGVGDNSCKTYYGTAMTEFLKLGNPEREVFMLSTDQDVINARERFLAWADANGDKVVNQDGTYVIERKSNTLNPIQENNNDIYPVIIISSAIAISSIAVTVLYAKKRKESSR